MPLITPSVITFYLSSFRYMDVANHQTVVTFAYGKAKDLFALKTLLVPPNCSPCARCPMALAVIEHLGGSVFAQVSPANSKPNTE
jgi:hypothetical protein